MVELERPAARWTTPEFFLVRQPLLQAPAANGLEIVSGNEVMRPAVELERQQSFAGILGAFGAELQATAARAGPELAGVAVRGGLATLAAMAVRGALVRGLIGLVSLRSHEYAAGAAI